MRLLQRSRRVCFHGITLTGDARSVAYGELGENMGNKLVWNLGYVTVGFVIGVVTGVQLGTCRASECVGPAAWWASLNESERAAWIQCFGLVLPVVGGLFAWRMDEARRTKDRHDDEMERRLQARARAMRLMPELGTLQTLIAVNIALWQDFTKEIRQIADGPERGKVFRWHCDQTRADVPPGMRALLDDPKDVHPAEGQLQIVQLGAMLERVIAVMRIALDPKNPKLEQMSAEQMARQGESFVAQFKKMAPLAKIGADSLLKIHDWQINPLDPQEAVLEKQGA